MSYIAANELTGDQAVIPLQPLDEAGLQAWKQSASAAAAKWVDASGFKAAAGQICVVPGADGAPSCVLSGLNDRGWLYQLAGLPAVLPEGVYRLDCEWSGAQRVQASLGWGLSAYRFERYKSDSKPRPALVLEPDVETDVRALCEAQCLVRDLVNTPTEHMGPVELADAVTRLADEFEASTTVIIGDELLTRNFPAVHAVGRASSRPPRLVELNWGEEGKPLLSLVGKGVCFDTGGLNLKTTTGMTLMKKDMGGAAHALALARLVMRYQLPVRLQLLIPAVENSVAGNAYRPGDVIPTRKGLSVEIGNTDAEGRVILADALAYACEQDPDLVVDFATLTGAARVALGADLPPLFSNNTGIAQSIQQAGEEAEDPLWTMPLYQPYRKQIESQLADLNHSSKRTYGGCSTAALFLESVVQPDVPWVHIDTFAWNEAHRPGRPMGGEALGMRAVFHYLRTRYA